MADEIIYYGFFVPSGFLAPDNSTGGATVPGPAPPQSKPSQVFLHSLYSHPARLFGQASSINPLVLAAFPTTGCMPMERESPRDAPR